MKTIRLMGHAGSDVEIGYKSLKEIEKIESNDPLLHSARILIDKKCLTSLEILSLYEDIRQQINFVFDSAVLRPKLVKSKEVISAIQANQNEKKYTPANPQLSLRKKLFGKEFKRMEIPQHMGKLINYALSDLLLQYSNTLIFGEDVAKKGGVYHLSLIHI